MGVTLVAVQSCRCRVPEWRVLRQALGLTQEDMGRLLCLHRSAVIRLEQGDHYCPREATIMLLRAALLHPEFRRRLAAAGYAHPWPEDGPEYADQQSM